MKHQKSYKETLSVIKTLTDDELYSLAVLARRAGANISKIKKVTIDTIIYETTPILIFEDEFALVAKLQ